ncbi:MAG: hypothetical protein HY691_03560 [Chloroflexi bacterium]|nr:hypothetical protein [Chloroflexota bacterium]
MRTIALASLVVAFLFAAFVLVSTGLLARPPAPPEPSSATTAMPGVAGPAPAGAQMAGMADGPVVPPVKGYTEGQEIRFIHTEASDRNVAQMLTDMMRSPVLVVPSLAEAPASMLASVYVFTNGVKGDGPFGFQPDVFDRAPGDPGYSPLRAVHLVTWKDERAARELRSVAEVRAAEARGEITLERPGAVVNMPFLTWPGGQR